jgi:hypothetical protein
MAALVSLSCRAAPRRVAGRQRTAVASTLMKMLRASDWSRHAAPAAGRL